MFVKKSTFEAMRTRAWRAEAMVGALREAHDNRLAEWNALVKRINTLGGEAFLSGRTRPAPQFTADELRSLIQLCHPDKHDGKQIATELTAKLLRMKESAQ